MYSLSIGIQQITTKHIIKQKGEQKLSLMVVMGQEFLRSSVELRLQGVHWVGPVVTSWSSVSYFHSWQMGLTVSGRPLVLAHIGHAIGCPRSPHDMIADLRMV